MQARLPDAAIILSLMSGLSTVCTRLLQRRQPGSLVATSASQQKQRP